MVDVEEEHAKLKLIQKLSRRRRNIVYNPYRLDGVLPKNPRNSRFTKRLLTRRFWQEAQDDLKLGVKSKEEIFGRYYDRMGLLLGFIKPRNQE